MPIINVPGVGQIKFPDEMSKEDIINAIENDILKRPKDQSRTFAEVGTDLAASLGKGIGQLAQVPGQIGMLSGLYKPEEEETGIQGLGKRLEQYSESQKSAGLKAREAARAENIQAQTGILDEARVALMSTVTDPALLTSFFAEQVPNLIGSFGIGAVAKGGTKLLMREATEQALQKAGVRSAIGGNAVMQGADIGADTYEETLARLKQSQPNLDPQKAQELALGAGRKAAIEAATISLGTSYLPGGSTIERALVGRGLPGVGVTKGILGETLSEGLEEAGGAFAKNLSMSDVVPGVDLGKGVGAAGAFGALGGAMFGTPAALMGGRQAPPAPPVAQPVPEQQLIPQQAPAEVATLPPTPGGFTAEQANQLRQEAAMQEQVRLQEQANRQQAELQAQQEADRAEQEQRQAEGARVAGLPGFTGMPDANQQIISQARADQAAQIKKDENARRAAINRVMKTTFSADPVMQTIAQQRALEELGVPRVKANEITKADPAKQAELIEAEAPEFIPMEKPQKKPRGEAFFEVTPEDKKEVADLRDNLASVNKDLKAAEAGKGNLFNYLKGKLVDRPGAFSLADIDKDNKRLRQLYNPKGQGALLEDLVADGALDEYLPFDNRSTIEGFDPQTAIEYIAEKLRNGENFNEESSVRLRDLRNQKEELKSRIENLTSIPAANYELGQMAEQPRGELTEAGMRDLEDDARSIGVDVDRLREELSDSMPSASVAEFYGAYQNALFAATSKSPSYSIDGNQYTEQEIEAAISERFTENEINELIAETEAQQTTVAETTEVTESAAEAAAPVRRADEAEAEATTTLEKPVQGKRAVGQGLPPILPELDKTPEGRHPQVAAAAKLRQEGKISREEFDEYVKAYKGIFPVSAEVLAPPASDEQVYNALRGDKAKSRLNPKIKDGTRVGLRMDLPAREAGTNVVSIHEGKENDNPKTGKPYSSAGDVIGYSSAARITDVKFAPRDQVKGIKMAYLPEKNPLQTAEGLWVNESPQAIYDRVMQLMRSGDPAWTQVNFDPGRHGYFYNRKTAEPVIAADEVLQVGNFLLAKNVQYGQKEDFLYSQKGEEAPKVDPEQAKMERELTGKSMIQAAQWAVNNAPNPFAKLTASKTLATIKDLEARGVTFNFEVQGGNERSSLLSGAEGLTHFLWGKEGTKVTVFLNGTPVFANQRGYPSGMTYDTLLHELLHVATRTSTRFLPPDHPLIKDLNELFNTVVRKYNADRKTGKLPPVLERYNKSMNNVLATPDELISWGMNDKEFQKYLSEIKVGEKTAFSKLIELVRKLIGMAKPYETALDRLVRTTEGLLDIDTEYLQNEMVSQTYSLGKPAPVQKPKPVPMRQQALFNQQGLFGEDSDAVALEKIKKDLVRYASGMSGLSDFETGAYARSGHKSSGIGVDVGLLSKNAIDSMAHAVVDFRVPVFVDSGAFGNFRQMIKGNQPKPLDFDAILSKYDDITSAIAEFNVAEDNDYPRPLFVMPDIVGNQRGSLDLIKKHKNWITGELTGNLSQPIIPIQKGGLTLAQAYQEVVNTLGRDDFIVGIPSNAKAVSRDDLIKFLREAQPKRVHFLGAAADAKLNPLLGVVAHVSPNTRVTADASKVRSSILDGVAKGKTRQQAIMDALYDAQDVAVAPYLSESLSKQAAPTPTAVGEQALEILSGMGREPKAPDPGYLQRVRQSWDNAVDNPKATAEAAQSGFRKYADMIETYAFSSDAALNNQIRRAIMESTLGQEEKIGALMNVSLSQTVHSDAISNLFLMKGDVKFNKELSKWEGVDSKYNIVNLSKKLDEIAAKYGLTKEQIQLISHTAFEAKRTKSLIRFNDQIDAEVAELRAMAAEERQKGNAVKASTLSEKASNLKMKQKYIHMTDEDIRAGMTQFDLMPELSGAVDIWNGIRSNAVKVLVDSGLWTEEEADFLLSNADYVPFYREDQLEQGKGPKEFMRSLQVQAKERRLKGTDRPVNDIFDNMVRWTQYSINRAVRNRSAVALAKTAEAVGLAGEVKSKTNGNNVISVWIDGKETFFSMEDPMFMQAFQGLESVSIPTIRWAAKAADVLRQSVVLYPMFAVAQIPQDSFAAMFSSGLKPQHALTIPLRAMKEFGLTLVNKSKTHDVLKNFGAVGVRDFTSAMVRNDAEVYAGLKAPPGLIGKMKNFLSHVAMASDNAVRQATYLAAQAQGLSQSEALEKAFEIFNVRRKGSSRALALAGQLIPFFNAYLAAQTVAYKTITGIGTSPTQRAEAYKILFGTTASVMTLSILYAMMNGDDDDYLNKPTPTRDRLLMIPGSGGLSIPLRSDLFTLPKVIAEHTYLMLTDNGYEDGRKFRDSMTAVLANAVLSPTAVPQVVKPFVEVLFNRDFFQNKPLIGVYQKNLETERQFTDSTSELAKVLGSTGVMSPIAIDHIIRGMFGSVGGLVMYATNPFLWNDPNVPRPELSLQDALATMPNASGFISKEYESALRKDFYQLREETGKASSTLADLKQRSPERIEDYITDEAVRNRLGLAPAVESIARNLTKIRQAITQITNSQMPADEKAREIRNLREAEREMLKGINLKEMREFAKI